jgi:leader peptidase (prepilin peptidase)/N-methyltransferase
MLWLLLILIFSLGCCVGSFLNVCIFRLPQNVSIVFPRSFCPHCQKPIKAYDNLPLLSYLFLKGKCRHCQGEISWRYPFIEALTGGLALALYAKFGLTLSFLPYFAFSAAMIVITFIDLDHRIIPDVITLPGIGIGFLLSFLLPSPSAMESLIGLVAGGGSLYAVALAYERITKREGMGGGDVKLLAMIGAWLGWKAILFTLFFASLSGSIIGGGAMLAQKQGRHYAIPFGPFLAFSALAYIFFGPQLIDWYLSKGKL